MKLSIIIVNYNVQFFLEQCLHSVFNALKKIQGEVFVVDNNSVDGSVEMLKEKFPQVKRIENKTNAGFSKANNQAIRQAKGEFILLLNPDTVVQEDTFEKTLKFMDETPGAGALGVMMVDGKGKFLPESKRGLPTPVVAFYKMSGLAKLFPFSKTFGTYHLSYLDKDKIHTVDVLAGAFMLIRKKALDQAGLLDEKFFMYGEDIDLSYRIRLAGYLNYYFPETRIIHYKGESTKKSSVNYVFMFYNAMLLFAKKHFSKDRAQFFSVLIRLAIFFRAGAAIIAQFAKGVFVPLLDAIVIFTGLQLIKEYYERNIRFTEGGEYDSTLTLVAFAAYILCWLGSVFISGGYDQPVKLQKILSGIFIGTGIILMIYALLPETLRFSRALILLGTGWTMISLLLIRMFFHFLKLKDFQLEGSSAKRIAIAGSEAEYKRVYGLMKESSVRIALAGFVSVEPVNCTSQNFIGRFEQLHEIIEIYKIDEVIFCAKDIPAEKIIDSMAGARADYKIAPPDSLSVIGSNSINRAGELYIMDVNSIYKPANQRKKRILDLLCCAVFVLLLPVLIFVVKKPGNFVLNIFRILSGARTWVGTAHTSFPKQGKRIIRGILSPSDAFKKHFISDEMKERLNMVYTKDYRVMNDVNIILKKIRELGA